MRKSTTSWFGCRTVINYVRARCGVRAPDQQGEPTRRVAEMGTAIKHPRAAMPEMLDTSLRMRSTLLCTHESWRQV